MAAQKEKVELSLRAASVEEVLPFIDQAARYNTGGWAFDAIDIAQAGARFVVERDGAPIAGYVLQIRDKEIFIMAAGAAGNLDYTKIGFGIVEGQAQSFDSVAFTTKRRGLVKKAMANGYEIGGWIMRKKLK